MAPCTCNAYTLNCLNQLYATLIARSLTHGLLGMNRLLVFGVTIDEVTCDGSAVKISTVAPQCAHASLGKYF